MDGVFSLVGEELNGVCFVMDYVEFHFNGPILRALNKPVLETPRGTIIFPSKGSRDALCALIGETVVDVQVMPAEAIQVSLGHQQSIRIPLGIDESTGPEAAHFVAGRNRPIDVF
jgi:hypothetical protein